MARRFLRYDELGHSAKNAEIDELVIEARGIHRGGSWPFCTRTGPGRRSSTDSPGPGRTSSESAHSTTPSGELGLRPSGEGNIGSDEVEILWRATLDESCGGTSPEAESRRGGRGPGLNSLRKTAGSEAERLARRASACALGDGPHGVRAPRKTPPEKSWDSSTPPSRAVLAMGASTGPASCSLSLVSFPVYFQCKRYKGSVGPGAGARLSRRDAGSRRQGPADHYRAPSRSEARQEATPDGAPPIDLIDGERLCDLLKKHEPWRRDDDRGSRTSASAPQVLRQPGLSRRNLGRRVRSNPSIAGLERTRAER